MRAADLVVIAESEEELIKTLNRRAMQVQAQDVRKNYRRTSAV